MAHRTYGWPVLDVDPTDDVQKARIKKLLAAWIESGVLKVQRRPSPKTSSRERPAVIVGKRVEGAANEP